MDNTALRQAGFQKQAEHWTNELRYGHSATITRLRVLLLQRGVDVGQTACFAAYDDMLDNFIALLVLPSGEGVECVFDYSETGVDAAEFGAWPPDSVRRDEQVLAAIQLLEKEKANSP
jgi:hypothetical protein